MRKSKWLAVPLTLVLAFSAVLIGCEGGGGAKTPGAQATDTAGEKTPQVNTKKVYRTNGGWEKPPLFQGNNFGAGGVGAAYNYVFEGLFQFVRSTDKIYNILAESIEHKDKDTIVKLRPNVKWQDGKAFTSKDIWAYYILNNGAEVTKYLKAIETPDESTVVFKWRDNAPFDEMKNLFIAQDKQATIAYHLYQQYVDKAAELLKKATLLTDPDKEGPFGLDIKDDLRKEFDKNWQAFTKAGPKMPVGTGPFTVKTVTASDMILDKNQNYWNKGNIKFEQIHVINPGPDPAAGYALLKSGKIDYFDGTPPKDILESILAANKDLAHYVMYDPATIGMYFNIKHKPFDDPKFRQALVYALDRSKIREIGNYYGKESDVSLTGMPQSQLPLWVAPDVREKMTKFTYNPEKAAQLLQELGWKKGSDGKWQDPSGKTPQFLIGANGGWLPAVNSGQVAAEQLTKFGLPTKLMGVDGSVYWKNATEGQNGAGAYDMSVDWVDVSWGFGFPWNSLRNMYWWGGKDLSHMTLIKDGPDKGKLTLKLTGPDGQEFNVDALLRQMPLMKTDEERRAAISKLAYGTNEMAFGAGFFQNATGSWVNTKTISGWPMEDELEKHNRDMPAATDKNDIEAVAETNTGFAGNIYMTEGHLAPK